MSLNDRAKTTTKNVEDNVQEAVSNLTSDPKTQTEGKEKQAEAKVHHTAKNVKMTDAEATAAIAKLPEWKVVNSKLNRVFKFDNFVDAFAFMTKIAIVAEKMDHHPEFFNVYNCVVIDLATHDVGGISALDIELAKKINALQNNIK